LNEIFFPLTWPVSTHSLDTSARDAWVIHLFLNSKESRFHNGNSIRDLLRLSVEEVSPSYFVVVSPRDSSIPMRILNGAIQSSWSASVCCSLPSRLSAQNVNEHLVAMQKRRHAGRIVDRTQLGNPRVLMPSRFSTASLGLTLPAARANNDFRLNGFGTEGLTAR